MRYEEHFSSMVSKVQIVLETTNNQGLFNVFKKILDEFDSGIKGDRLLKKEKPKEQKLSFIMQQAKEMNPEQKLEFFKGIASKNISYERVSTKRYQKYRKIIHPLTSGVCYICGGRASCMHHVIPLICGGNNRKRNLIPVCEECHKKIHTFMK